MAQHGANRIQMSSTDQAQLKILLVTQDENLYLPEALGRVCAALRHEIVVIVTAPAMSTHGGFIRGFFQHFRLFGWKGTTTLVLKTIYNKALATTARLSRAGPFYSIKHVADSFEIAFQHVNALKSAEFADVVKQFEPDLLVSISCPQIIGKSIRDKFSRGCINVHGSPLPRYRGLMPAFWVLRNGERTTATTVHELAAKLDDGEIILQRDISIESDETWDSLVRKTKSAGAEALIDAVQLIRTGEDDRRPNREEEATYYSFPSRSDQRVFLKTGRRFF